MNGPQSNISPASALAVYGLPGDELKAMILEHVGSIQACAAQIAEALGNLPPEGDDVPEELRKSAVFRGTLRTLDQAEAEAKYLAEHVPLDHRFMLTATQLLSFKQRWGRLTVDVEKLAMAPRAAPEASSQAERSLASTVIATPRILLPDGTMNFLGR